MNDDKNKTKIEPNCVCKYSSKTNTSSLSEFDLKRHEQNKSEYEQAYAAYQKLMEEGSILRKEDLQKYLEDNKRFIFQFMLNMYRFEMLSRMLVIPPWDLSKSLLTCPVCKNKFTTISCHNLLLLVARNIDITPDFSSICPHCHKEITEGQRKLRVTIQTDGKKVKSDLSHDDIHLLFAFCAALDPRAVPRIAEAQYLTSVQKERLKQIFAGDVNEAENKSGIGNFFRNLFKR